MMRNIFVFVLTLILVVSLAACGTEPSNNFTAKSKVSAPDGDDNHDTSSANNNAPVESEPEYKYIGEYIDFNNDGEITEDEMVATESLENEAAMRDNSDTPPTPELSGTERMIAGIPVDFSEVFEKVDSPKIQEAIIASIKNTCENTISADGTILSLRITEVRLNEGAGVWVVRGKAEVMESNGNLVTEGPVADIRLADYGL